jgi:hypothetical protein
MDKFEMREKEIFTALKTLQEFDFVVVGGYAVSAYTLPRFSTDCDIVVSGAEESEKIELELVGLGYSIVNNRADVPYAGEYKHYIKEIEKDFSVSMDILIGEVTDRQTDASFSAKWIFDNSEKRTLQGKTISEELQVRIINIDALFVMKTICARDTDIRDVFMLVSQIKDVDWVKKEIQARYDLNDRLKKIISEVSTKQFRDGLQGVFGKVLDKQFERQKGMLIKLLDL